MIGIIGGSGFIGTRLVDRMLKVGVKVIVTLKNSLTGWAQTNYQYAATIEEQEKKLSYDLYYVKNQSTLLDLQIILKTFETVLFRKGAK